MKNKDNRFLSTEQMGTLLGVTRQTIRNWIKKGDVGAYHIGQNLKVPVEEAVRILLHYDLPIPDWLKDEALEFLTVQGRQDSTKGRVSPAGKQPGKVAHHHHRESSVSPPERVDKDWQVGTFDD